MSGKNTTAVKKTPTRARLLQNKRITSTYFRTEVELHLVKRAAKKKRMTLTAFLREAALQVANDV